MGIFKKFSDLIRSNINNLLDQAENPQKLAELALLEAQTSKKKAQALLIQAQSALNLNINQLKSLKLDPNQDPQEINNLEQEKSLHEKTISTIKNGLEAFDRHISSLKSKITTSNNKSQDPSAFDTFSRMEEKIDQQEAELEALQELLKKPEQESLTNLEKELEELKKKLKS